MSRKTGLRFAVLSLLTGAFLFLGTTPIQAQQIIADPDEVPAWRDERLAAPPDALLRPGDATDRAFARLTMSNLEVRTMNYGPMVGADGWYGTRYPASDGRLISFARGSSIVFAVEEGPWHSNAQVHEAADGYYNSLSRVDWEAPDGARGTQFADPPALYSNYPLAAISNLPATLPSTGWPAPEAVEDVWEGTTTWFKWKQKADQETYMEFDDTYAGRDGTGEGSPLGISVRKRALAYSSQDVVYFQHEITNTSSSTYTGVFVGQMARIPIPGRDSSSYYNRGFPRWDASRQLLYTVGRDYDPVAGTHTNGSGVVFPWGGHLWLESPTGSFKTDGVGAYVDDPTTVLTRLSLTQNGDRVNPSDHEWSLYGAISGDPTYFESPLQAEDVWKMGSAVNPSPGNPILMQDEDVWKEYNPTWDTSSNSSLYMYAGAGPITLAPGESVDYVVAIVAGNTEQQMLATADKAIRSYQAQFQASGPPPTPVLEVDGVTAGPAGAEFNPLIHRYPIYYTPSGTITLNWDGRAAETTPDPITTNQDFQGYRIYKSIDRGSSWGEVITDSKTLFSAWGPYAQYDLEDGITGEDPGSRKYLGDDTGIVHTFTDSDVTDGLEVWYSITTYDYDLAQDPVHPSYESALGGDPTATNTIAVIAGARPSGYVSGLVEGELAPTITPTTLGGNYLPDGTVTVSVLNDATVQGATYRITTSDTAVYGVNNYANTIGVTLTNVTSGDVLFTSILPEDDTFGTDIIPAAEGLKVSVSSLFNGIDPYDRLSVDLPAGLTDDSGYDGVFGEDFLGSLLDIDDVADAAQKFFAVEVRFDTVNTQMAYYYERSGAYPYLTYDVFPGTVWDVTSSPERQINVAVASRVSGGATSDFNLSTDYSGTPARRYLNILSSDYSGGTPEAVYMVGGAMDDFRAMDSAYSTWWNLEAPASRVQDLHGSTATIGYMVPIGPGITYEFTTTAPTLDAAVTDLDDVKVVPNPYYLFAPWDQSVNKRKIQFTNVPANSTIDIYTLSGELVASLDHHGDANAATGAKGYSSNRIGTVDWNIWTYEFTEAAYGLYIYVVKTDDGQTKVGKFAIIR